MQDDVFGDLTFRAGDRIRTDDVQPGKPTQVKPLIAGFLCFQWNTASFPTERRDRHGIFEAHKKGMPDYARETQFSRALRELGTGPGSLGEGDAVGEGADDFPGERAFGAARAGAQSSFRRGAGTERGRPSRRGQVASRVGDPE